jgi:hypothetical protein
MFMRSSYFNFHSPVFFALLAGIAMLISAAPAEAQKHVVSPAELHQQLLDVSRTRAANIEKLSDFFASPQADHALRRAHLNPVQVQVAISTLSDQELAQMSARATQAQRDFAAGALSDRDLIIILVGIAVLILIIVAVR